MSSVRSLRSSGQQRPLNRIRDPHERLQAIERISMRERISEEEAEKIADRLTIFERTILDIEMREKNRAAYTSDYDIAAQMYGEI